MRRTRWAYWLWPGLRALWTRGSWAALVWAVCAAGLLNLAILGTWVWSELLGELFRTGLWGVVGVIWLGAAAREAICGPGRRNDRQQAIAEELFREALDHYLKGNWFETERVLGAILRKDPRDLEARLMLATLLRRAGRPDEAALNLDALARMEGAETWQCEIDRERQSLEIHRCRA
jgi:hypothetical protein